jgi:hypothetical protein
MEPNLKVNRADASESTEAKKHREGPVARAIESNTARLPSDVFLWGSLASVALSLALQFSGNKKTKQLSNFVAQWAPTILTLGLYNKIVKVAGHDRT